VTEEAVTGRYPCLQIRGGQTLRLVILYVSMVRGSLSDEEVHRFNQELHRPKLVP